MVFASDPMEWALVVVFILIAVVLLLILWKTDLSGLLMEADGSKASLSRVQFLIFTIVIAGLYLALCLQQGQLLDVGNGTLVLLGISGSGYAVSKGISKAGTQPTKPAPNSQGTSTNGS